VPLVSFFLSKYSKGNPCCGTILMPLVIFIIVCSTYRNSASSVIKQKLIFAGTEKGKLLALGQSFQEVCKILLWLCLHDFH
jgi:hypothetical protein